MIKYIENDFLQISVNDMGAELYNIKSKKDNSEILWHGDSAHWGYRAPTLFPIIGKVNDDKIIYNSQPYTLEKHGFVRKSNFELFEETDSSLTFVLESNDATKKIYPFDFIFKIKYELFDASLKVTYSVENTSDCIMYFSVGGHPAFACPNLTDFYLEFEQPEVSELMTITADGYFGYERNKFLDNEKVIQLDYKLFENDALVFSDLKSKFICIKSHHDKRIVTFEFSDFPLLGIWTKQDAPFVCIEPWIGHADFVGFHGEIKDKAGIISLDAKQIFDCSYSINVD